MQILAIIGKSLNHKNQNTTAIYAPLVSDSVRDSVNTATTATMAAGLGGSEANILNKRKKDRQMSEIIQDMLRLARKMNDRSVSVAIERK